MGWRLPAARPGGPADCLTAAALALADADLLRLVPYLQTQDHGAHYRLQARPRVACINLNRLFVPGRGLNQTKAAAAGP